MIKRSETRSRDWLVTQEGQCQPRPSSRDWNLIRENYYLHQFLTEILDLLGHAREAEEEWDYLPQIRMRVRQLITNSYWLKTQYLEPDSKTGVAVHTLYDEIGYPLTVQTVTFAPGTTSSIHNHGTWGVTAVLKGQEKQTFWRRCPTADQPQRIEPVGEKILTTGQIISFVPEAIHQVEAIGEETTVSFQIYGDTQPRSRFLFDPTLHTAKPF